MSEAERLLDELRARAARKRVSIDDVWVAFRAVIRGYTGSAEARSRLASILGELHDGGRVGLPRSPRLWDRLAEPRLPAWIALTSGKPASAARVDHRAVAWPPELAFVAELARAPLIDELLAVRRFLSEGGRERIFVPSAERSLELFDDEKRLAALRKTSLFGAGRLSLELLRCYEVAPPLVWEVGPADLEASDRAILVLENLHSYESFCRWNARSGAYAAVAYGHGSEFLATVRDLPRVCSAVGSALVEYFGDLDSAGLRIPSDARTVLLGETFEIELRAAERWYAELLEHAEEARTGGQRVRADDALMLWLPEALRSRATSFLEEGRRLPQEHVGFERLSLLDA